MRQNAIFSHRCISRLSHDDPIRVAFTSSPISFATDHINFLCFVLDSQVFFSFTLSAAVKTFSSFFPTTKSIYFVRAFRLYFIFYFFLPSARPTRRLVCNIRIEFQLSFVNRSKWNAIFFCFVQNVKKQRDEMIYKSANRISRNWSAELN